MAEHPSRSWYTVCPSAEGSVFLQGFSSGRSEGVDVGGEGGERERERNIERERGM